MSATQAYVGIDAGTTGCTVMIFDEQGNRLGQGYQEYPCTSPRAGWIEQEFQRENLTLRRHALAVADGIAGVLQQLRRLAQQGTVLP